MAWAIRPPLVAAGRRLPPLRKQGLALFESVGSGTAHGGLVLGDHARVQDDRSEAVVGEVPDDDVLDRRAAALCPVEEHLLPIVNAGELF